MLNVAHYMLIIILKYTPLGQETQAQPRPPPQQACVVAKRLCNAICKWVTSWLFGLALGV